MYLMRQEQLWTRTTKSLFHIGANICRGANHGDDSHSGQTKVFKGTSRDHS